jgi:hypothetical protein
MDLAEFSWKLILLTGRIISLEISKE